MQNAQTVTRMYNFCLKSTGERTHSQSLPFLMKIIFAFDTLGMKKYEDTGPLMTVVDDWSIGAILASVTSHSQTCASLDCGNCTLEPIFCV